MAKSGSFHFFVVVLVKFWCFRSRSRLSNPCNGVATYMINWSNVLVIYITVDSNVALEHHKHYTVKERKEDLDITWGGACLQVKYIDNNNNNNGRSYIAYFTFVPMRFTTDGGLFQAAYERRPQQPCSLQSWGEVYRGTNEGMILFIFQSKCHYRPAPLLSPPIPHLCGVDHQNGTQVNGLKTEATDK